MIVGERMLGPSQDERERNLEVMGLTAEAFETLRDAPGLTVARIRDNSDEGGVG